MKSNLIIAAAFAAASLTPAAAASPPGNGPSVAVSFAGLDLRSEAGREILQGRVHRAAEQMCSDEGVRELARTLAGRRCMDSAIASANDQIALAITRGRPSVVLASAR